MAKCKIMKYLKTYEQNWFNVNDYINMNGSLDVSGLKSLDMSEIVLDNTIKYFYCCNIDLSDSSNIPKLSEGLLQFGCDNNNLTELPELPNSLEVLYCDDNRLKKLPKLPEGLKSLYCRKNDLTELPELPKSLKILDCKKNRLPYSNLDEYWKWYKEEHPDLYAAKQMGLY